MTVLNVDNEVVVINEPHVSFSGVGRQKPKVYVVELELYAPIDPAGSSWQAVRAAQPAQTDSWEAVRGRAVAAASAAPARRRRNAYGDEIVE